MNRMICVAAFFVGLAAVGWVGAGYAGSSELALTMTALIGAVYMAGAVEMLRFDRATAALARALAAIPENLSHPGEWLARLPAALQNPVRLRIEGERVGLPGPAVTPYLVGLLVLLGMMGTFLGMLVTLNGAVIALEGTTDLHAIRSALAAPVKGLGVAFGTSVAGVAASAMLGLISVLCRRARLCASQLLDTRIATTLRGFSLAHQRQETFQAVQLQARALPELVDKLEAMMARMERQGRESDARQLAGQERFYREAGTTYAELAASVDRSLKESLTESARLAGETMQPVVAATMAGIAQQTTALQERVADAVAAQLGGISERFDVRVAQVADTWTAALAQHERASDRLTAAMNESLSAYADTFEQRSAALLSSVEAAHAALRTELATTTKGLAQESATLLATIGETAATVQAELAAGDEARRAALTAALASMAASLQQEWRQAGAHTLAQQQQICETVAETAREITTATREQASGTIAEVARLVAAAEQAPRAAAEVIGELRHELSASIARDNALLAERSRIMETLGALLDAINHASTEQRDAIDALVTSSATLLERAGTRFDARIDAESARITEAAGRIAGGAVEVASLADAFGLAVQRFGESNDRLMAALARIEGALGKSMTRSDEQLAYYVAQAREIIDLSIMSQRQIVEDLQQLSGRQAVLAGEA
ncbi:MAG TPA: DUF802 domain-containing protein [Rhodocyclaceae bacterium]|nr:DUF802 domain-containing protein [Rhodocyclaceae bacterium]